MILHESISGSFYIKTFNHTSASRLQALNSSLRMQLRISNSCVRHMATMVNVLVMYFDAYIAYFHVSIGLTINNKLGYALKVNPKAKSLTIIRKCAIQATITPQYKYFMVSL